MPVTSADMFTYSVDSGVSVIAFNDPGTLNAITPEMAVELTRLLALAGAQSRCTVITGHGRGFCSGANLASGAGAALGAGEPPDMGQALESAFNPMIRAMRDHPVPLITSVNGPAAGIGASIALMGDLILASESAYFLQAFARIGLVPDGGATLLLPASLSRVRAMELTLLAERLPAAKALEWGLINRVCAPEVLEAETLALARTLADGPTRALGLTRRLIWQSQTVAFDAQLDAERNAQRIAGTTADFVIGVQAFLSRTPARFQGH